VDEIEIIFEQGVQYMTLPCDRDFIITRVKIKAPKQIIQNIYGLASRFSIHEESLDQ